MRYKRYVIIFKYKNETLMELFTAFNKEEAIKRLLSFRNGAEVISVTEISLK